MSANKAEQLPQNTIVRTLKQVVRANESIKETQTIGNDSLNLQLSASVWANWPTLLANQEGFAWFKVSSPENKRLLGFWNVSFYETAIGAGNEIGHGDARDGNFRWSAWTSWADTDNNDIWLRVVIVNTSAVTRNVYAVANWRYIISDTTAGVGT